MDTTPLKRYFFAGATASLAVVLFVWHIGYTAGLQQSAPTPASQVAQSQLLSDTTSSISGRITNIASTTLTILAPDSTPVTRKVLIDQGTVFGFTAPKDPKTFQSEILDFDLKLKAGQANGTPVSPTEYPTPFGFRAVPLSELRKGDLVTITATGPILSKSEFTAMTVIVQNRAIQ